MYYHRHKQRINIPLEVAPQQYRWCTNRQKSNNFSRRRISSAIQAAALHYHHQLIAKGVGYRCLVGYYATRRQIEAYGGRRWPSFDRRGSGLSLFVRRSGFQLNFSQLSRLHSLLFDMPTSTNQANFVHSVGKEDSNSMPISAAVQTDLLVQHLHMCLL